MIMQMYLACRPRLMNNSLAIGQEDPHNVVTQLKGVTTYQS